MADAATTGWRIEHWNGVYLRIADTELSWFESSPTPSLGLFDLLDVTPDRAVVDVGAGASRLVDALLDHGFDDLTALDVSDVGLARSRERLGDRAARVTWVVADLLTWEPGRRFDVWHDRAVFHFLTDPMDRARYVGAVRRAITAGGLTMVATFAEDGPQRCSGLDVCRYSPDELADALGDGFTTVTGRREEHRTPWGAVQPFTWLATRRTS